MPPPDKQCATVRGLLSVNVLLAMLTRQSEMADLARRATSVCTKFHRDRLRND